MKARRCRHWGVIGLTSLALLSTVGCGRTRTNRVVVYTSQDQVYAEPIFKEFTRQTGLEVLAVFDAEAVKTVGLANRLLAERHHPQCDVFWNNEELRTRQLEAQGLFRESEGWVAVGYRSRRLVVNTNRLAPSQFPRSLRELTNGQWLGRVALAYPLFGTSATHFLALRQAWGEGPFEAWTWSLLANKPLIVDGNALVARMVARGEAWVGLTDSDDIAAEQGAGAPVAALPLTEDSLLIPNTVAVLRGAPHPENGARLVAFLQRPEVTGQLVEAKALEGLSPPVGVGTLRPRWNELLAELPAATTKLRQIFLR